MSNQTPYNGNQQNPASYGQGQRGANAYRRGGGRYGVSGQESNRQYANNQYAQGGGVQRGGANGYGYGNQQRAYPATIAVNQNRQGQGNGQGGGQGYGQGYGRGQNNAAQAQQGYASANSSGQRERLGSDRSRQERAHQYRDSQRNGYQNNNQYQQSYNAYDSYDAYDDGYSGGANRSSDNRRSSREGRNGQNGGSRYSSYDDGSSRTRGRSSSKAGKRRLGLGSKIGIALGCLILLAGIGVFAYASIISANLHEGVDDELLNALVDTDYAKEPFYMLLMGVDTSVERGADGYSTEDSNSDSMMLVRIDCPNHKVTMVSLHRDTELMINGKSQKLNAAHAIGGPALAVETVSDFAGVDISHYAEINFDAFRDLVDSLGGVEVEVTMEIDDELAGGYVPAGRQTLNGTQALILCRARHAYDDYGDGDVYRAANQRMVLGAIAKKILKADVLTIANSVRACSEFVTTDMSLSDIVGIAQALKGLDPSTDIYSAMEPTEGVFYEGDGWYEEVQLDEWYAMMDRVRDGLPPTEEDYVSNTGAVLASTGSGTIEALN